MKRVTLETLTLTNFKGHKERTIQFSDSTTISGRNGIGKSTIFDAFTWLLFGKDQFDRKDYEIIPTINNKRLEKVDSDVCAILYIDGMKTELRRVLHQKWVRKRGTAEEVFDGTETLYYINSVPKKAGEYKTEIDSIIEESVFKLITNPAYFLSLHWEKQREILFRIAGTISDAEVLDKMATLRNKQEIFNLTNILNSGKSLADHKKELSARKKKLKDDLDLIPSRIDQTQRLMPETVDFPALKSELMKIDAEIEKIDKLLENRSEAIREQYNTIQEKQKEINRLKLSQGDIINEKSIEEQKRVQVSKNVRAERVQEISVVENKIKLAEKDRDRLSDELEGLKNNKKNLEKRAEDLRQEWDTENAKEFSTKSDELTCPLFGTVCTDPTAKDKFLESKENARKKFIEDKTKKLEEINEQGSGLVNKIAKINEDIEEHETAIKSMSALAKQYSDDLTKLKTYLEQMPVAKAAEVVPSQIPAWSVLEEKIKVLQKSIDEAEPIKNEDLTNKKKELNLQRDTLKEKIGKKDLITQYEQEIEDLKKKASDLAQQIADLEKSEFTMYEFEKVRIEESEKRVNRMFQIVRFKMFDYTNEGNEFTCCIATNRQGVPISATNTAEEINAGLDIINVLCEFNNVSAPIFVDRCESVNDLIETKGQIISLVVTREPELTISNHK